MELIMDKCMEINMKKQSGFTLIELIIVVVILGFLAVTAIPKMLDITDQAKKANINGMAGGFTSAISLARSQWEAEGRPKSDSLNQVNYDGTTLLLTSDVAAVSGGADTIRPGFVVALSPGTAAEAELTTFTVDHCLEIWNNIYQQPPIITETITKLDTDQSIDYFASQSGSGADALCHYYLKETLEKSNTGTYVAPANGDTLTGNNFTYQPAIGSVRVYVNN